MTTWYRVGTVSVTNGSGVVAGAGTAWIANVREGDAIHLPDGRVYEVTGIASNTSLTITPNYLGSTASGQSYAIQPTRGVMREVYDQITAYMAALAGQQAGPLAGRFGDGTASLPGMAFLADLDTGLRRPGNNRLALVTGGVDRVEVTAAGDLLVVGSPVYRRANLLGTVTQSGGVPTGAVIERGSNANGEFVRFADGTQICTRVVNVDVASTAFQQFNYAATFATSPMGAMGHRASDPNPALQYNNIHGFGAFSANWTLRLIAAGTSTAPGTNPEQMALTAIGRWF